MLKPEKRKLIVVYKKKDELALNYLKKLVETNDDKDEKIVGTEDNTVSIIDWTEKDYQNNKVLGNIPNKILFLDDIKETKKLVPIMDIKYSSNGISYGFIGKKAIISINEKALNTDEAFMKFQKDFFELIKSIDEKTKRNDSQKELELHQNAKLTKVLAIIFTIAYPILGLPIMVGATITNSFDKKKLREKMFLYAITKFYLDEMDDFMRS